LKKIVILLILAGAGYFGYRTFIGKSAASQAYLKFADALVWGRSEEKIQTRNLRPNSFRISRDYGIDNHFG
jgi:hypothetical protein